MNNIKVLCIADLVLMFVGLFLVSINPFGRPTIGIIFIIIAWIMVVLTYFMWRYRL